MKKVTPYNNTLIFRIVLKNHIFKKHNQINKDKELPKTQCTQKQTIELEEGQHSHQRNREGRDKGTNLCCWMTTRNQYELMDFSLKTHLLVLPTEMAYKQCHPSRMEDTRGSGAKTR